MHVFLIASAWKVFILNTGVGHVLNCAGEYIIAFHDDEYASFNINNFYTKKSQHTWEKCQLKSRPYGHIDSMVYIEIPRHGLLWMHCPGTLALELNETIHK